VLMFSDEDIEEINKQIKKEPQPDIDPDQNWYK
jgi:hypothetical protein